MAEKQRKPVILFGASGHAKVCIDIFVSQGRTILGLVDKDKSKKGAKLNGVEILGDDEDLAIVNMLKSAQADYFVAIGDNTMRENVIEGMIRMTAQFPVNAIHPDALISTFATIGIGNFVNCGVKINASATVGNYTIINTSAVIDHDTTLEDYVQIGPGAHLASSIVVGRGACIWTGASVIPKIKIGKNAVVGAGAAVIGDIPPHVTAVGIPAKVIKRKEDR